VPEDGMDDESRDQADERAHDGAERDSSCGDLHRARTVGTVRDRHVTRPGWSPPAGRVTLVVTATYRRFAKYFFEASAEARSAGSASNFASNFFHAASRLAGKYSVGQ
jgi:hypothetical protein